MESGDGVEGGEEEEGDCEWEWWEWWDVLEEERRLEVLDVRRCRCRGRTVWAHRSYSKAAESARRWKWVPSRRARAWNALRRIRWSCTEAGVQEVQ